MKIRAEELRQLSIDAHRQMSLLPAPSAHLGGALKAFQQADADVEEQEGKLRRIAAFDVSVRFGLDEFLDTTQNPTPYFAVVAASVNFGALFQGSANERAARGRHRLIRSGHDPLSVDATSDRLKALLSSETRRAARPRRSRLICSARSRRSIASAAKTARSTSRSSGSTTRRCAPSTRTSRRTSTASTRCWATT